MGWASGSSLCSAVIKIIKPVVDNDEQRRKMYKKLIGVFEDANCDTLDECLDIDPAFDEVFNKLYPPNAD